MFGQAQAPNVVNGEEPCLLPFHVLIKVYDPTNPEGQTFVCLSLNTGKYTPAAPPQRAQPHITLTIGAGGVRCETAEGSNANPDEGTNEEDAGPPSSPPRKSGLTKRVRRAILDALGPNDIIAFRGRAFGSTRYDGFNGGEVLPMKPEGAGTVEGGRGRWGRRTVIIDGREVDVVSDLDIAWALRDGQLMDENTLVNEVGGDINSFYGRPLIQHGSHVRGVLKGAPGAKIEYLLDDVYIFSRNGYLGQGPMLGKLKAYAGKGGAGASTLAEIAKLEQILAQFRPGR